MSNRAKARLLGIIGILALATIIILPYATIKMEEEYIQTQAARIFTDILISAWIIVTAFCKLCLLRGKSIPIIAGVGSLALWWGICVAIPLLMHAVTRATWPFYTILITGYALLVMPVIDLMGMGIDTTR